LRGSDELLQGILSDKIVEPSLDVSLPWFARQPTVLLSATSWATMIQVAANGMLSRHASLFSSGTPAHHVGLEGRAPSPNLEKQSMHIDLEQAEKAIAAARKEAIHLKTKMCIAVVDSGANLRSFIRMDDAWVGSIDIAIKKAKTACFFTMGSGDLGKLSQPGRPLYGIEHSNGGLITFPGGLPIIQNGELFGAIGVSGSSVENDHKVAAAGCKVLGESELADHHFARMMKLGA
jgi:uncharacterized protein GlcG (DUF336 family)